MIETFGRRPAPHDQAAATPAGFAALPDILARANAEIQTVLANLRDGRSAIETATVAQLQHTSAKLQEVTSATEVAATDILDALDRAEKMVDELEAADQVDDKPAAQRTRDRLREEIFGMMGALQFQDITTQQLAYAGSVLADVESRLLELATLFGPSTGAMRAGTPTLRAIDPRTFDPRATTRHAESRQSAADAIFVGVGAAE